MIELTKAFRTSTGVAVFTVPEAQAIELVVLLNVKDGDTAQLDLIQSILSQSEAVVDILTFTKDSRPKARKINGGKKTRKPKIIPVEPLPSTA